MDARTWGIRAAVVGVVAQLAGVGIDAWLHVEDPELATREGLFTFTNAGHALLIGGLTLTILGVAFALVGQRLYGPRPVDAVTRRLRRLRIATPAAVLAVLGVTFSLASASSLGDGHVHPEVADDGHAHEHDRADSPASADGESAAVDADSLAETLAEPDHGHGHGTVPNQPMDDATRDALAEQLVTSRETAMRFPTVADAEAAGYRMVTPYVPLIGAHYIRFDLMDGNFDVTAPEMLLYDGTAAGSRIVGLSYYVVTTEGEPAGFAGPNDHWHQHIGLCLKNLVVIGGENMSDEKCRALGGQKVDGSNGWMVHAWVVPGWESPQGVFSPEHTDLT